MSGIKHFGAIIIMEGKKDEYRELYGCGIILSLFLPVFSFNLQET